jgi:hypothetical protein
LIPTLLIAGLIAGRLWAVPVGAVGWAALLLLTGTIGVDGIALALALGAVNAAAGVAARRALAALVSRARRPARI